MSHRGRIMSQSHKSHSFLTAESQVKSQVMEVHSQVQKFELMLYYICFFRITAIYYSYQVKNRKVKFLVCYHRI